MKKIYSFEDLEIWVAARKLANKVYDIIEQGRIKKDLSLSGQLKRAVISPMSNIAEGFLRGGNKEFIQYLFMARGSAGEAKSQLYFARDRKYINKEQFDDCDAVIGELLNKIDSLIKYLKNTDKKGIKHVK